MGREPNTAHWIPDLLGWKKVAGTGVTEGARRATGVTPVGRTQSPVAGGCLNPQLGPVFPFYLSF